MQLNTDKLHINLNISELETLKREAEKVRFFNPGTGARGWVMPTCRGISHLFEGMQTMEDKIIFK